MAKILSKYVNLPDTSQKIEYTSQKEYIEALSYNPNISPKNDIDRPYSFRDWYDTRINIIPGQEYTLYNLYLSEWYADRNYSSISTTIDTQQAYLDILNQLQSSFTNELVQRSLDINDPAELINEIPKYAKKIKDIARYFILKRESIRKAKLKYNMVGTNQALERLLYEYLLKAFTKNEINTSVSTLNLPELSASQNLNIVIEELYDNASYFDRDPVLPVSSYFLNTSTVSAYLSTHDINTQDEFEWLYNTGVSQLCADNPLLWAVDEVISQYEDGLPLSAIESATTEILNDYNRIKLTQKYLGTDQYIISGGYYVAPSSVLTIEMVSENNWFCWPGGQTELTVNSSLLIDIPINETSLLSSGATPSYNYETGDVIFVRHNGDLKGAWLQSPSINTTITTMSAEMKAFGKTEFVYPFPGYGVMAEDIVWTGRQYNNLDKTFYFLEKKYQTEVLNNYWNDKLPSTTTISAISLSSTNLIANGAHAGDGVLNSDIIVVMPNFSNTKTSHIDTLSAAWLYENGGSPVWCVGLVNRLSSNEYKGYDIWHGNFLTYELSQLVITPDMHIDYYNSGTSFVWEQPVTKETYNYDEPEWKKLDINVNYLPPGYTVDQLAVSGTNITSDIVFSTEPNNPQEINYYAVSAFTWNQTVIDSTLGLPPTGGNWVPILSGELVTANKPYVNLTNRHFPTYASAQYTGELYSNKESGGYMIPKNLGTSIALTRNNENILETRGQTDPSAKIFQDINIYNNDVGLTKTSQYTPVSTISVDSEWMKAQFIEGNRAGIVKNPTTYQEFIPYQSTYETFNKNKVGILQQQDSYEQYETVNSSLSNCTLIKWDNDIFGNEYGLYELPGFYNILWIRDLLGNASVGHEGLSAVYSEVVQIYSDLISTEVTAEEFNTRIKSFNIFFDTIVFVLDDAIITAKLSIDFDTGGIYTTVDDINSILIESNMTYVDHYFFPTDKTVTLGFILVCDGLTPGNKQIRPLLYSLDLNTNDLSIIYNESSVETDFDEDFVDIYSSVMTYDPIRFIYNITFNYYDPSAGMYLISMNVQQKGGIFEAIGSKIIEPI